MYANLLQIVYAALTGRGIYVCNSTQLWPGGGKRVTLTFELPKQTEGPDEKVGKSRLLKAVKVPGGAYPLLRKLSVISGSCGGGRIREST